MTERLFAGRPGIIDCYPKVVDSLPFFPFRNEGKEEGNETLLHYQIIGEVRLLLAHGCYHLAQVSRCLAGTKEGDVAAQGFHLINIYSEGLLFPGERLRCFAILGKRLLSKLVALEVLLCLCSVGEDLVIASVYIESYI